MKIVKDNKLRDFYIKKYSIDSFFSDFQRYVPYIDLVEFMPKTHMYFGEETDHYLYFIVNGCFKVYANMENGNRMLLRDCPAYMMLGEMELLKEYAKMDGLTVEASKRSLAIRLDYRNCEKQLMSDICFLRMLCMTFAEKLYYFGNIQTKNTMQPAEVNVANYILASVEGNELFDENKRKMAAVLGISYQHLFRMLNKLIDKEFLVRVGHAYRVVDRDGLKAYIDKITNL